MAQPSRHAPRTESDADAPGAEDDRLLARYARGDHAAARALTARHTGRVLAQATRLLGDATEAEDVAQEAMMRVWRAAPDWRPGEAKLSTWLHTVARNLCVDRLRKRRERPLDEAREPPDDRAGALERLETEERADALRAAVAALPDRQQTAIRLRHFEERGNEEIAALMGLSVEAVESLLARGRRALRKRLAAQRALLMEE